MGCDFQVSTWCARGEVRSNQELRLGRIRHNVFALRWVDVSVVQLANWVNFISVPHWLRQGPSLFGPSGSRIKLPIRPTKQETSAGSLDHEIA
jgi:hypothetical protein